MADRYGDDSEYTFCYVSQSVALVTERYELSAFYILQYKTDVQPRKACHVRQPPASVAARYEFLATYVLKFLTDFPFRKQKYASITANN